MEHPFFPTTTTRAESLRWLGIAEKLLSARDLMGSKSFATRARDSDPTLTPADQILSVVDTLLAGDRRIGNNHHDWYAILRLTPQQGRDSELIASQYRNLAVLLNPRKNTYAFADQAFRLVVEAWSVLSNPSRKLQYDKELGFYMPPQQHLPDPFSGPVPASQPNFIFFGGHPPSSIASPSQPQVHVGASSSGGPNHFPQVQQVHSQPQVDPVGSWSSREPQNFMNFASGSNPVFGSASGSGSKSSHEPLNKHGQESFPSFPGADNISSAPGLSSGPVNDKQKEQQGNYPNVSHRHSPNVNVSENVAEERDHEEDEERVDVQEEERLGEPENEALLTFWTACPYCYHMYEYPSKYTDCTMKCQNQNCRRAYQAVIIPSPPPIVEGQECYFSCWGFIPLGFSMENWEKNKGVVATWSPFSPMFTCPQPGSRNNVNKKGKSKAPRVYVDDDDVYVELSDSGDSDDDWQENRNKKQKRKVKNVKGNGTTATTNKSVKKANVDKGKSVDVQEGVVSPPSAEIPHRTTGEPSKKGVSTSARKQPGRVAKNFGKLDLNVELSNEAEEPAPKANQGNGPSRGEDDNIEGIGFFEGLDEFLSSLPILNVVGDDKVVKAA